MYDKFIVSLAHEQHPDHDKVDAGEDDRFTLAVELDVLLEFYGEVGPVHCRLAMMTNVITVIEASSIVSAIDHVDAARKGIVGPGRIDKGMLPPVSRDHRAAAEREWNDEHDERGLPVDHASDSNKNDKSDFTDQRAHKKFTPVFPRHIAQDVKIGREKEPEKILEPASEAISLIGHRRTEVFLQILLDVVHSDVMREVDLGRFTKERPEHPNDVKIEIPIFFSEERPMT